MKKRAPAPLRPHRPRPLVSRRVASAAARVLSGAAPRRLRSVGVVVALGCALGLALSSNLWLSDRLYPPTPVWSRLPAIPSPVDYLLFASLLGLLLTMISPGVGPVSGGFVVLAVLVSVWDQSRWQPWFYQYVFMLAALGLIPARPSADDRERALNTCRVVVVSVYVWSGLQKLNLSFLLDIVPLMAEPLVGGLPPSVRASVYALGGTVPFLEVAVGIGLLTARFRHRAVLAAAAMHVLVMVSIGPTGHAWNRVVWPWNVAMVLLLFVLFWRIGAVTATDIIGVPVRWRLGGLDRRRVFHILVVVLFGVLPALSFVDAWDGYLSWALYSGNIRTADIYVAEMAKPRLPVRLRSYLVPDEVHDNVLSLMTWSMGELGVPPYPEVRVFRNVARGLCGHAGEAAGLRLRINDKPNLLSRLREVRTYTCSDLSPRP